MKGCDTAVKPAVHQIYNNLYELTIRDLKMFMELYALQTTTTDTIWPQFFHCGKLALSI